MGRNPAQNTRRSSIDILMLAQRLRRWPNIKTTVGQGIVSSDPFSRLHAK